MHKAVLTYCVTRMTMSFAPPLSSMLLVEGSSALGLCGGNLRGRDLTLSSGSRPGPQEEVKYGMELLLFVGLLPLLYCTFASSL